MIIEELMQTGFGREDMDVKRAGAVPVTEREDEAIGVGHGSISMQGFLLALHNQQQQQLLVQQHDAAATVVTTPQSFHLQAPLVLPYCLTNHSSASQHLQPDNHLILAANQSTLGITQLDPACNQGVAAAFAGPGASSPSPFSQVSRYEAQKRRDWNTFGQYLKNHRPALPLCKCSSAHVLEFMRYLDQFGKTKVHTCTCPFFGLPNPTPPACPCPLRQAWGSLDALIGRLRAAYDEHTGGQPESNPFGTRAIRLYLREVRELQAKARGIAYAKKKRKRPSTSSMPDGGVSRSPHASTAVPSSTTGSTTTSQVVGKYANF